MSDLTDEELDAIDQRQSQNRKYLGDVETTLDRAVSEIRRHRAAQTASEERVEMVVHEIANQVLTDGEPRWSIAKHQQICDAIATRAAKQLAGAGLSEEDKQVLCWLFGRATDDAILGKSGGHGMMDFQLLTDARAILLRLTGGKP